MSSYKTCEIQLQSVRKPECFRSCLLRARVYRRLQFCEAIAVGGRSGLSVWSLSLFILSTSLTSAVSHSSSMTQWPLRAILSISYQRLSAVFFSHFFQLKLYTSKFNQLNIDENVRETLNMSCLG